MTQTPHTTYRIQALGALFTLGANLVGVGAANGGRS